MTDDTQPSHELPTFRRRGLEVTVRDEYLPSIRAVEQEIGYRFRQRALLVEALLHPSMREKEDASYERLEFLGDAVLGVIVAEDLFHRFPDSDEGELTRIKSSVVSRTALARVGRALCLADRLILGKGMLTHDAVPRSVIANSTEALIGALFLDGGLEVTRGFVMGQLEDRIRHAVRRRHALNHKSLLQQWAQQRGLTPPTYRVLDVSGPDHEKTFVVAALLEDQEFPSASGLSKKTAEQRAARTALRMLQSKGEA